MWSDDEEDLVGKQILSKRAEFVNLLEHNPDNVYEWLLSGEPFLLYNDEFFFFDANMDPPPPLEPAEPSDVLAIVDSQPNDPREAPLAAFLYHKFINLQETDISGQDIAIVDELVRRTPDAFYKTYSIATLVLWNPLIATVVFGLASKYALLAAPTTNAGRPLWIANPALRVDTGIGLWVALTTVVMNAQLPVYADILLLTASIRFPDLVNTRFGIGPNTSTTIEHLLTGANARHTVDEDFIAALIEAQDADMKKNLHVNVLQLTTSLKSIRLTKMAFDRIVADPKNTEQIHNIVGFNRQRIYHLEAQGSTEEDDRELHVRRGINDILEGRRAYVMTKRA